MNENMQTILGAGGSLGNELARVLAEYTDNIRLVSRNPSAVNPTDELFPADLLDPANVDSAVEGSSVVYVTIAFPYRISSWRKNWPPFIRTVTAACIKYKCKLVFFDNIYMYDRDYLNGMTEEAPIRPTSKKGLVRKEVASIIMDLVNAGKLTACIARSADFYGPGIKQNSILTETVFKPLSSGKNAIWLASSRFRHSYTYIPDAARATAILGNSAESNNQIWHLPTASNPFTGKEWIEAIAAALHVKPKYMISTNFLLKIMGLFTPELKEIPEMIYQYDRDYVFNSDKFEKKFGFTPTPYTEGIRSIVEADYS